MSQGPRYAPKSRYRTRQSGAEMEGGENLTDTAIDRPVVDLEELRRQREAKADAAPSGVPPIVWALVIGAVLLAVFGAGAIAAWLALR